MVEAVPLLTAIKALDRIMMTPPKRAIVVGAASIVGTELQHEMDRLPPPVVDKFAILHVEGRGR